MTAGVILVIVMLVLGGVIAMVSDRLGTKVGKARLSLFKLRPRTTAVIVTIVTGSVLSALTLTILFASSKPLRRGVFKIDEIQVRLNQARKDLTRTEDEKKRVEASLSQAKTELDNAIAQLNQVYQTLQATQTQSTQTIDELNRTQAKLSQTQTQLNQTQTQLDQLQSQIEQIKTARTQTELELQSTEKELDSVFAQKQALQTEIEQLKKERQNLIKQRQQVQAQIQERDREIAKQDQEIDKQDQEISERDEIIAQRETLLKDLEKEQAELEKQQALLKEQVQLVERDFQLLREGNVGLKRGQVLASGLVRIIDPAASLQAINQLLQQANRNAVQSVQIGNSNAGKKQVIQITKAEVEELIDEIDDGRDHVVQVIAAANYLVGETQVAVFTKAEPNRLLFTSGEVIAGTSLNPAYFSNEQLQKQLQQLLDASSFRARFVGVVDGLVQIGDDQIDTYINFFQQLKQHDQPIELQAVAAEDTYTVGPLRLDLLALQNGAIIFSTRHAEQKPEFEPESEPEPQNRPSSGS